MNDHNGFEERLRQARSRQGMEPPQEAVSQKISASGESGGASSSATSPWGAGLRVGTELLGALMVGLGIGLAADRWLGTKPWLLLLFLLLGGAAGVLNLYRMLSKQAASNR